MVIESFSSEDTFNIGYEIGKSAAAGSVYTLIGDLGVGKTVFTQGVAAGLGIREAVNSPTFTILQVYDEGRLPLYTESATLRRCMRSDLRTMSTVTACR